MLGDYKKIFFSLSKPSEQSGGLPVKSTRELEMIMKPRKLKVSNIGDFFKREEIPQIRLQGKWLKDAGIETYSSISVTCPQPGILVIKAMTTNETS